MAAAPALLLAAVLLCCSSAIRTCPESCTCQTPALLNCSSSGLSSVPQQISDSVTEIDLSDNLLSSVTLQRAHHNLRNVRLGNNSIRHLSLCAERHLGGHYVRGRRLNHLRHWSRQGCVSWAPNLQLLSAEMNQLKLLPEGLEGSESLQVLQLSFNRISNLRPGDLSHLKQLKELHLRHNLITSLHPQMFKDLSMLKVVDLSFNMLASLHPSVYLSLHNIGADVRVLGNRWKCDCTMKSLRRQMAHASSRGLHTWSVVCASPSNLSGRDLLQLEEEDLNCFTTENNPARHQDVTVYRGSEILLSCSTPDSMERTPIGQGSLSQLGAGLLVKDITERETGLYVCVSEKQEVVTVFNLQISKVGGAQRKARSLPGSSGQIIPEDTENRSGQDRNQRATQSELALAVCLSIIFTFLVAFILGILARPCIDALCKKVGRKEKTTTTHTVSTAEQRQYDNEAFYVNEEQVEMSTHRERRVTFSADSRNDVTVQYYDTVASGDQDSINDNVFEGDSTFPERDRARDSDSDSSSQQSSPRVNQGDSRDLSGVAIVGATKITEFEHIPDPVEHEIRRHSTSSSNSSLSDHPRPKPMQLAEESIQQRANISTTREVDVPNFSIKGQHEIPGFTTEPFGGWSPHADQNLADDPWQHNEEQFEFSDRSPSPRSSTVLGTFNDSKLITSTLDKKKSDDTSSSSSYLSENETTHYTVNAYTDDEDTGFEQQIQVVNAVRPTVGFNQSQPGVKKAHSFSSTSSDSEGEGHKVKQETVKGVSVPATRSSGIVTGELDNREKAKPLPHTQKSLKSLGVTIQSKRPEPSAASTRSAYSSSSSSESETENKDLKIRAQNQRVNVGIKGHYDINDPLPASDSSSSDESAKKPTNILMKHGQTSITRPQFQEHELAGQVLETQRPALLLEQTTLVKSHGDIKAPSPAFHSSSSSESEDESKSNSMKKGNTKPDVQKLPITISKAVSYDQEKPKASLKPEHTTQVKRPPNIKALSLASDSSSSSDSEEERQEKVVIAGQTIQKSQTGSQVQGTSWPSLKHGHIPSIKRRLDIKATSPVSDSSSSSDSDNENTNYLQTPGKLELEIQKSTESLVQGTSSSTVSQDHDAHWPVLDLKKTTRVKRRLDIKAKSVSSDSSSSSDSEDESTIHIKKQEHTQMYMERLPVNASTTFSNNSQRQWPHLDLQHTKRIERRSDIKAKSPASDSSSSTDSEEETGYVEKPGMVVVAELATPKSQTAGLIRETKSTALDVTHTTVMKRTDLSSSSDSEDEEHYIKKQEQINLSTAKPPIILSPTLSHDPQTQWPVLNLEQTTRVKRHLDIKAKSQSSDSSSSSDSENETTIHTERIPVKVSPTFSSNPQRQWPLLDLQRTKRIKRRLDIKTKSPASGSSSSSDSEDQTNYTERPGKVVVADLAIQKSQTADHVRVTMSPGLNLERTTSIKTTDSSSSSDSENEEKYTMRQEQDQLTTAKPPIISSPIVSYDLQTQWPVLNLERTKRFKRRLDIKVKSQSSDSSSSSDSEDETTIRIKEQQVIMERLPIPLSPTFSRNTQRQWPLLDLQYTRRIKRRLDIKAKSPASDSSSSSDSEGEKGYVEWPGKGVIAANYVPETKLQNIQRTTSIKTNDSSSSSDSEDETNYIKKQEISTAYHPVTVSQTLSHDLQTTWPVLNLERTTRIKRHLDIRVQSQSSDSSSSSDSEDEATSLVQKQAQGQVHLSKLPVKESVSYDPRTQWPSLELDHTSSIKSQLDFNARSPDSSSSPSSDSEKETIHQTERQDRVDGTQNSLTASHAEEAQWPTTRLKRRLDIKAPSAHSDSSSSSDSEDETRNNLKIGHSSKPPAVETAKIRWRGLGLGRASTVKSGLESTRRSPSSKSSSSSDEGQEHTTDIYAKHERNKGLDVKATLLKPDPVLRMSDSSSSTSEGEAENKYNVQQGFSFSKSTQKESIKSLKSPVTSIPSGPKTDGNIKLEKFKLSGDFREKATYQNISTTPEINPELQSRWASMSLGTSRSRKRPEITSHVQPTVPSPPPDSPTSSSSESGSEGKSSRTRQRRRVVGLHENIHRESSKNTENTLVAATLSSKNEEETSSSSSGDNDIIDHSVPDLSFGVPRIKRRLYVKAPSSASNSENEATGYIAKQNRQALKIPQPRDTDTLITYKRSIFQATSPTSESPPFRTYSVDEGLPYSEKYKNTKKNSSSFDDLLSKITGSSKRTIDGELPPEIRWTGISRQMSEPAVSSPMRRLDIAPLAPPAEPELPPPDSSSSSSSESDDERAQDKERSDVTVAKRYSSLSSITVPSSSTTTYDLVENTSISTNEILRSISEEKRGRKGLGALQAMSSDRRKWDSVDGSIDYSASRLSFSPGPGAETTFHYQRSEEHTIPQASQSLTQVYRSSTLVDERTTDLLYEVPHYRGHGNRDMEPPLKSPPPIPMTPPPAYEQPSLALSQRSNSWKERSEGTRSYLTQSRTTGDDSASRFFDSSKNLITEL